MRQARAYHRADKLRRRAVVGTLQGEAAPEGRARERGSGDLKVFPLVPAFYGQDPTVPLKLEELTIHCQDMERLSLPGDANPEPLKPLEELLPPSLVSQYQRPVLRSPRPKRAAKGVHLVSPEVYPRLIELLIQRQMISFVNDRTIARDGKGRPVYNGLFKIAKDDQQFRLIMDGRPSNSLLPEPANPELPSPESILHDLRRLTAEGRLSLENSFIWKRDIKNFYYRLRVPGWLIPYQGLPPLTDEVTSALMKQYPEVAPVPLVSGRLIPCLHVLTMGMSHSVLLAQSVTRYQLHQVMSAMSPTIQRSIFVEPYIDDINVVGDASGGQEFVQAIEQHFEGTLGLGFKRSKDVDQAVSAELIGVELRCRTCEYGVSTTRQQKIVEDIRLLLSSRDASPAVVEVLVGKFAWVALVNRILYCLMQYVYVWLGSFRRDKPEWRCPQRLWKCVRKELKTWARYIQFCFSSLRLKDVGTIISDASPYGCGVGYTATSTPAIDWVLQPALIVPNCPPVVKTFPPLMGWYYFQFLFADAVLQKDHINVKELVGCITGIHRARRSGSYTSTAKGRHLTIFGDNVGVLSILRKGRSKSFRLNRLLQKTAI